MTEKRRIRAGRLLFTPAAVLLVLLLPGLCAGQEVTPSLGFDLGWFVPLGDWTAHPYAEGVQQFKGGPTLGGELELRIFGINMGFFYTHTKLDVDDWVNYALSQGDDISASCSMKIYGIVLKHYFGKEAPNLFDLELGLAHVSFDGRESHAGHSYPYNFLTSDAGFVLGLSYKRLLSPRVALVLNARGFMVWDGVRYVSGERQHIFGLPLTAGVRLIF